MTKKEKRKDSPLTDKEIKFKKQAADEDMDRNMQDGMVKYKSRWMSEESEKGKDKKPAKDKYAEGGMVRAKDKYAEGGRVKGTYKTSGGLESRGNGCARRGFR